jgi:hypothetical protein
MKSIEDLFNYFEPGLLKAELKDGLQKIEDTCMQGQGATISLSLRSKKGQLLDGRREFNMNFYYKNRIWEIEMPINNDKFTKELIYLSNREYYLSKRENVSDNMKDFWPGDVKLFVKKDGNTRKFDLKNEAAWGENAEDYISSATYEYEFKPNCLEVKIIFLNKYAKALKKRFNVKTKKFIRTYTYDRGGVWLFKQPYEKDYIASMLNAFLASKLIKEDAQINISIKYEKMPSQAVQNEP